jgi:AcrR family transcriptional regulator
MHKQTDSELSILNAARKVFLQKGFWGARMADIAVAAGQNKALLHYYFRSKENLFEAVLTKELNEINKLFGYLDTPHTHLPLKLEEFSLGLLSYFFQSPESLFFVAQEMQSRPEIFEQSTLNAHQLNFFQQYKEGVNLGLLRSMSDDEILWILLQGAFAPFLIKPIFVTLFHQSEEGFDKYLERYLKNLPKQLLDKFKI